MKKLFTPIFVSLLILAGCSNSVNPNNVISPISPPQQNPAPTPPVAPPQSPTPTPQSTQQPIPTPVGSSLQTYHNSQYNFAFNYPEEFAFNTPVYSNLNEQIVQLGLSNKDYPKTNFGDAAFTVSVQSTKSLNECITTNLPEGIEKLTKTKTINGTEFYTDEGTGAAAGNRYETHTYRTFVSSNCFEINETIHTANIGNYDPAVTEVNTKPIWKDLEGIMSTFKFTN